MRLLPLAFIALLLTGCASLQRPDIEPLPATLAEVNRALEGHKAMVYFADGREPERGYVTVGPTETVVQDRVLNGRTAEIQVAERIVPTAEILRIELDASLSTGQGAGKGALLGAAVGLLSGIDLNSDGGGGGRPGFLYVAVPVFTVLGAGAGTLVASSRDWVPVYEAPITRYPDAALALLEREHERGAAASP